MDTAAGMVSHIFTCPSGETTVFFFSSQHLSIICGFRPFCKYLFYFILFLKGLHFNKFTDSCDYANNVGCKSGAGSATTTTVKPFLPSTTARAATTTTRATTTRATTTARTTTTRTTVEPEVFDYVDELVPARKDQQLDSPEELQQLLQLISDLGINILNEKKRKWFLTIDNRWRRGR